MEAPYWASKPEQFVRRTGRGQRDCPRCCDVCDGKGPLNARCRCDGKSEGLDGIATKERGTPVFKMY